MFSYDTRNRSKSAVSSVNTQLETKAQQEYLIIKTMTINKRQCFIINTLTHICFYVRLYYLTIKNPPAIVFEL